MRICFCNPFGTDQYDDLIAETVSSSLREGTQLDIVHLTGPKNIDYYTPKHLIEVEILKSVVEADRAGYDAYVIGCCYDPALTQARELTDIPVVGPLEATVLSARYFGHRFSVVTDHRKAVPEIEDRVRIYGMEANCRSVSAIDWYVDDMIKNPEAVAKDAYERCLQVLDDDRSEVAILGCTIIGACLEHAILGGDEALRNAPIVNPNVMAVKTAEMLADLRAVGQYRISRRGYYQQHEQHDPVEAAAVRRVLSETQLGKSE